MSEDKLVLVVEDEGIIAMHIANTLTSFGYEVSLAVSAEEAMRKVRERRPALALMDIMLGGSQDGIAAAAELSESLDIPIVYLTGHADEKTVTRAKATHPFGYVLKPFHERQLATTVELAIQRHAREATMSSGYLPFSAVLETLSDAVVLADAQGRAQVINAAAARLAGCSAQAAAGIPVADLFGGDGDGQRDRIRTAMADALRDDQVVGLSEIRLHPAAAEGGDYRGDRMVPLYDQQHHVVGAAVIFHAVTGEGPGDGAHAHTPPDTGLLPDRLPPRAMEAASDAVTGLPSRAEAEVFVTKAVNGGNGVFVAPLKVERFDFLHQRFGKSLADTVLQYYGVFLAQELSPGDYLFRWTGPCFVVVMQERTSLQDARRNVARFASVRLEQLFDLQDRSAVLFISASWTVIPVLPGENGAIAAAKIDEFVSSRLE